MRRVTLTQFLVGRQQSNGINADLRLLVETIARACKAISTRVNKGALADGPAGPATSNVHGELQKKLDVLSNEILLEANVWGGNLAAFASEEEEKPVPITEPYKRGEYLLLIDPLDGSSNIDVNISVGTIFSILRCPKLDRVGYCEPNEKAFLHPGSKQVRAGRPRGRGRPRRLWADPCIRHHRRQPRARLHPRSRDLPLRDDPPGHQDP